MQGRHQRPIGPVLGALWVTHGWKQSQWSSRPISCTVVPVARAAPPRSIIPVEIKGIFPDTRYYAQYERSSVRYWMASLR
jgi:hypothetical protein